MLTGARKTWLIDALREAGGRVDQTELKRQVSVYAPEDAQRVLASAGIRDEDVFPTPVLLEAQPTLVGYYRLLLGVSQKAFYRAETGMTAFKAMEERGTLNPEQQARLPDFCEAMGMALADLIRQVSTTRAPRDIVELPLLTLGSQFQGGNNNTIGQKATEEVFLAIAALVEDHIVERGTNTIRVLTPTGRTFVIAQANDPDVRVQEQVSGAVRNQLSIEIKGGTDKANVYNRGGEAEKSHQPAKMSG